MSPSKTSGEKTDLPAFVCTITRAGLQIQPQRGQLNKSPPSAGKKEQCAACPESRSPSS